MRQWRASPDQLVISNHDATLREPLALHGRHWRIDAAPLGVRRRQYKRVNSGNDADRVSFNASGRRSPITPAIRFNFLSAPPDRKVKLEAMRITKRIMTAPAMAGIALDEIAPGVNIGANDDLLDWVWNNAETTHDPVGPARRAWTPCQ